MKIKTVQFSNFRGQTGFYVFEKKLSVILYENSKGKTTLLKALRYAFVGDGNGDVVVTFEVDGEEHTLSRSDKTTKIDGRKTTNKNVVKFIENLTGCSKEALDFLMSATSALENFNAKDFASFLYDCGYIEYNITVDKLISFCGNISAETENSVREYFDTNGITEITEKDIEEANDYFCNKRKETKAIVDKLKKELASLVAVEKPEKQEDVAQNEYDRVTAALIDTELYEMIERANAKIGKLSQQYDKEVEKIKRKIIEVENNLLGFMPNKLTEQKLIQAKEDAIYKNDVAAVTCAYDDIQKYQLKVHQYNQKLYLKDKLECLMMFKPIELKKISMPKASNISELLISKKASALLLKNWDEYKKKEKKEKELLKEQENFAKLNAIVSIFEEGSGVRQQVLSLILQTLADTMNDVGKKIGTNLNISFVPLTSGGIEIRFNKIPYKDLSLSERRVVETLVFDLISNLSGLGILLCDNYDCLDCNRFENTIKLLLSDEVSERYDTIIVTAVNHDDLVKIAKEIEKTEDCELFNSVPVYQNVL